MSTAVIREKHFKPPAVSGSGLFGQIAHLDPAPVEDKVDQDQRGQGQAVDEMEVGEQVIIVKYFGGAGAGLRHS